MTTERGAGLGCSKAGERLLSGRGSVRGSDHTLWVRESSEHSAKAMEPRS